MKTNDLIDMLSRGPDVAAPKMPVRRFAMLITVGVLISVAIMASLLGVRPNLDDMTVLPAFRIKIAFVVMLAIAGAVTASRLALPGRRINMLPVLIAMPLMMIWSVAGFSLMNAAPDERAQLFWGDTWRYCPFLIALLALPIFAVILNIMRSLAPTRLRWAGASAGFAAGTAATLVYSLHCPEIEAPFIGFWYVLGILIPTCIGTLIGPRILRW